MLSRIRHRTRNWRIALAVLLLLALVWQPVLLTASEAHASEHLVQTGHAHDVGHSDVGIPADEPANTDGSNPLHELLHLGHCCASLVVLAVDALFLNPPEFAVAAPDTQVEPFNTHTPGAQLRPPIKA